MPIFIEYLRPILLLFVYKVVILMNSIIFLRHGQAENNTKRMLTGRTKGVALTQQGIKQAHECAHLLKGHKIAHIYSSPMERAYETARITAEHNNIQLTVDERLTELDMGSFTGSKYDDIMTKHGNVFLKFYKNDPGISKYDVETLDHLRERILDMVDYVRNKHPGESVVLATHMDPIKVAISHAMNLDAESIHDFVVANASLTILGIDDQNVWIRAINLMPISRFDSQF
ncbi:MAG: Phosphoglycerate mutase [Cenarchaeum symbiont of Oopsacas minuta]|nr:Phosphoglycerate mutase [Cenarchaeum symbiont of Oopsacas minuta]